MKVIVIYRYEGKTDTITLNVCREDYVYGGYKGVIDDVENQLTNLNIQYETVENIRQFI